MRLLIPISHIGGILIGQIGLKSLLSSQFFHIECVPSSVAVAYDHL